MVNLRLKSRAKGAKAPSQNCIAEELGAFAGNKTVLLRRGGRRSGNHALQLNLECSVVSLDATANRDMSRVSGYPDRKLTFLLIDESIWSKQLWIHSQHINASEHGLHSLLLDDLNRYLVNLSAVADKDLKAPAHLERLCADEIDR